MADITDPVKIARVNQDFRPMCEALMKLDSDYLTPLRASWDAGINVAFAVEQNGGEVGAVVGDLVVDNRQVEGVEQVTRGNVLATVDVALFQILNVLNQPGVRTEFMKMCVRKNQA